MFPALHRHAKRAAGDLGREAISRKQAHFPQVAGGGAAARAAGQGVVLHPPFEGEHLGLSGTGQPTIVHIGPLGEGGVRPQGLAQLRRADFAPKTVMITSLQRTRQTAEVLFPDAELVVADGLKEMAFGVFEGRNYREMERDPQYRAWVETGCEGRCPGGESKEEFCQRVCTAFAALVDAALAAGEPQLVIVAHGGTQMAAMERFAVPHKNYYSWCAPAAGGFVLDAADWVHQKTLRVVKTVQYTKELPC